MFTKLFGGGRAPKPSPVVALPPVAQPLYRPPAAPSRPILERVPGPLYTPHPMIVDELPPVDNPEAEAIYQQLSGALETAQIEQAWMVHDRQQLQQALREALIYLESSTIYKDAADRAAIQEWTQTLNDSVHFDAHYGVAA